MRYLKFALYALAAILVVVGGVIAYVAATFDPNAYKDDLAALVKDQAQRTLIIDGDIALTFFPRIGVKLGRTTLSEYRSDAEFAGVDQVRVALALFPLLSRQVVVDEVVVEGLHATIVKHKDGSSNLDDLLSGGEEQPVPKEAEPAASAAQPIKLDVQGVRIGNAALTFRDERARAQYSVTNLMLVTGQIAPGVPAEFRIAGRLQASDPAVDLNVDVQGRLEADLDKPAFTVVDLRTTVEGKQGSDRIELKLEVPRLSATADQASAQTLALAFKSQGPQLNASGMVKASGLEASAKTATIAELAVEVNAQQADNAVEGRLATPVNVDLDKQTVALSGLDGKFDVRSPALPMQHITVPMSGRASADLKRQSVDVDLTAKVDESNTTASLGMVDFGHPRLSLDAAVDRLNLDRYTAPATPTTRQKSAGETKEEPIDLSALKTLDLDGRVRIGELVAAKVTVSNVQIDVKARNGKVNIDPLLADLYQGRMRGAIGIDANSNRFSVRQSLSGVLVGPLLKDALAQDLLEGRGDIALDLTATGGTVSMLMRSLSGGAKLRLQDGAIKGINLAQSLRNAKDALSLQKDSETAASPDQKTDFSELTASFTIKNGKAHNEDLSVKSPFLRLSGAGDVDMVQGGLDYLAKATVVASSAGQGGKELADLAGLTVPVRISGPLTAPKFKLELSSAFAGATKLQLKQKKEELKEKFESRLQDKLLGGKPTKQPAEGEAGSKPADSSEAEPQQLKPEDELKKKLKGMLR
jgi:AsmA protein